MTKRFGMTTKMRTAESLLPLYASRAAIELDKLLKGTSDGLTATREFARRLISDSNGVDVGSSKKALANPATELLMSRTLRSIEQKKKISTIDELREAIEKLANLLQTLTKEETAQEDIQRARDFCSSLALAAASSTYSISRAANRKMKEAAVTL